MLLSIFVTMNVKLVFILFYSKWPENVEMVKVQPLLCSGKRRVYWNKKESNASKSVVGLVQVYLDMTVNKVKCEAFAMYQYILRC